MTFVESIFTVVDNNRLGSLVCREYKRAGPMHVAGQIKSHFSNQTIRGGLREL